MKKDISKVHPVPTGPLGHRVFGAKKNLLERAAMAYEASKEATDERHAAALRGKAAGLREGAALMESIEVGRNLRRQPFQRRVNK